MRSFLHEHRWHSALICYIMSNVVLVSNTLRYFWKGKTMMRKSFFFSIGLAWPVVCLSLLLIQPIITSASGGVSNQHQGVPAYFYPNVSNPSNGWPRMCSSMNMQLGASTAVMNPSSGPGSSKNSDYVNAVQYCHSHGQLEE